MHLIVRLSGRTGDVEQARLARAAGLAVEPLSRRAMSRRSKQGLLLGFTNIAEAEAIAVCDRLKRAVSPVPPRR
jgi:GntR family transcriptional regulator/MocR family aminotransferase